MKPARGAFTEREWALIQRLRTPLQVQRYLNALPYNTEEGGGTLRTFRGMVKEGNAHCLEAALSAAVIMEQHGLPPLLLDLASQDGLDHVLFLYRKQGRWGTVARSRDPGLHGRKPVFRGLRALVNSYFDPYVDYSGRIVGYGVCDLRDLGGYDWRLSARNVWKVERHLIAMPHKSFHGSDRRYDTLLQRYRAYRERYGRKPLYYQGKETWSPGYPKG